jgi:hypothetical protein
VDAGSHDKGSWQIVSSREIRMASEIREAANILEPTKDSLIGISWRGSSLVNFFVFGWAY